MKRRKLIKSCHQILENETLKMLERASKRTLRHDGWKNVAEALIE